MSMGEVGSQLQPQFVQRALNYADSLNLAQTAE